MIALATAAQAQAALAIGARLTSSNRTVVSADGVDLPEIEHALAAVEARLSVRQVAELRFLLRCLGRESART